MIIIPQLHRIFLLVIIILFYRNVSENPQATATPNPQTPMDVYNYMLYYNAYMMSGFATPYGGGLPFGNVPLASTMLPSQFTQPTSIPSQSFSAPQQPSQSSQPPPVPPLPPGVSNLTVWVGNLPPECTEEELHV
jgi:hypothetical protein